MRQGDIYFANLSPVKGHEQAGFRPVLIMQNNILNNNLNTVIIAPITSNLKAKGKLTTYFLSKKISKLKNDSVILLFQIRTLDKNRLQKRISCLNKNDFFEIKSQLRFVF
ncbi:type II toxin-antitoxin system PemK/MazF family toxin [Candidatus Parcubacteria bacterium]|nr:type II toxin-antitoxin system PemK/MazF family toxin [Candidatus Parcubacteria bacterium]